MPKQANEAAAAAQALGALEDQPDAPMMEDPAMFKEWLFCPISGRFLDASPETATLDCKASGFSRNCHDHLDHKFELTSDVQAWLRKNEMEILPAFRTDEEQKLENVTMARCRPVIDESCPKCKHVGMRFHTMQLRSADEGQTVFFECVKCMYKFATNS